MQIQPKQPSRPGPPEMFSGIVWIDAVIAPDALAHLRANSVHFTPGARTAWHCHANGQTLHVTEGRGLAQAQGGPLIAIRPGDTIHTPPGEWHWHGADPEHFMTHFAMLEAVTEDARDPETQWGAHVTDAEYSQGCG